MHDTGSRVFISCGQATELDVASRIEKMLTRLGFAPYLGAQVHSARGLRENIFQQLRETEYFLFVDFRRERLAGELLQPLHRGSLFSHQELAIASFLDLDVLAFQEQGVKPLDGMLGHLQLNAISFADRSPLPELIEENIRRAGWRNNWRNQLSVEQSTPPYDRAITASGRPACFFHLKIRNRHQRLTARNCYGYLRSVTDTRTKERVPFEVAELKWAGYTLPNATIPPGSYRKLDALWFDSGDVSHPSFNAFTDWGRCLPALQRPGSWELEYEVISDNIPGSTLTLSLQLETGSAGARFGQSYIDFEKSL